MNVPIAEQAVADDASGLTLIFWRTASGEGRLHVAGEVLPHGNRDFCFDAEGVHYASGSAVAETVPARLRLMPTTEEPTPSTPLVLHEPQHAPDDCEQCAAESDAAEFFATEEPTE